MFTMKDAHVNLSQLLVFVAVAEYGSFTQAAEVIGMSQSGISHAIAGLERELSVTLFARDRGGAALTDAGRRTLTYARQIAQGAERLRQEAVATTNLTTGTLRIGGFPSASSRLLPGMIGGFSARYPGIELMLREGTDDEVRTWIRSRDIDLGFVTLPAAEFDTIPVARDAMVVVVPKGDPLAAARQLRATDLASAPFILSKGGCEPLIRAIFRMEGVAPRVRFEIRDTPTVLAMVEAGLGIAIVPSLALPSALSGVATIALDPPAERQLALAVRLGETTPPVVRAFIAVSEQWTREEQDKSAII